MLARPALVIIYGRDDSEASAALEAACRARGLRVELRLLEAFQPAPHRREALAKLRAAAKQATAAPLATASGATRASVLGDGCEPRGAGPAIETPLVDAEGALLQAPSVDQIVASLVARGFSAPELAPAAAAPATEQHAPPALVVYTTGPADACACSAALVAQLRALGLSPDLKDTLADAAAASTLWALARAAPWWRGGNYPMHYPLVHAYGRALLQQPGVDDVLAARRAAGLAEPTPPPPTADAAVTIYTRAHDEPTAAAAAALSAALAGACLAHALRDVDADVAAARALFALLDAHPHAAALARQGGPGGGAVRLPIVHAYGRVLLAPGLSDVRLARAAAGLPAAPTAAERFGAAALRAPPPVAPAGALGPPPAAPPLVTAPAAALGAAFGLDYDAVLAACAQLELKFEDPTFPADARSLFRAPSAPPRGHGAGGVAWLRPCEQAHGAHGGTPFPREPTTESLMQGRLADGWLLAAAAAAASAGTLRARVEAYAPTAGAVAVSLWADGGWRRVVVDDRIPCEATTRAPLYARAAAADALWVCLIQKAVAKLFGSYEAVGGGADISYGLRMLTGGAPRELALPPTAAKAAGRGTTPTSAAAAELAAAVGGALGRGSLVVAVAGGASAAGVVPGGLGGLRTVDGGLWRGRGYAVTSVVGAAAADGGAPPPRGGPWLKFENRFAAEGRDDGVWSGLGGWLEAPPVQIEAGLLAEDGASWFWMPASDALRLVSHFKECQLLPDSQWHALVRTGGWTQLTAGGGPQSSAFPLNPTYVLRAHADAEVLIQVHTADRRLERARQTATLGQAAAIGFVLAELPAEATAPGAPAESARLTALSERPRVGASIEWARARAVGGVVQLRAGRSYALVPCTLAAGHIAPFTLSLHSCAAPRAGAQGASSGGGVFNDRGAARVPVEISCAAEPLAPPATAADADALIRAYRDDLGGGYARRAAPSAPAACAPPHVETLSALAAEAAYVGEAEGVEWDARLPAADPRLPTNARLAVQVHVVSASGLPARDPTHSDSRPSAAAGAAAGVLAASAANVGALPSVYVIVTIDDVHKRRRARTRTAAESSAPRWDQAFDFDGVSADALVVVDVFDADPLGFEDFLGKVVVPVRELVADGRVQAVRAFRLVEGALELGFTVWP